MATQAGIDADVYQENDSVKRRSNNVNKRKRESIDVGQSGNRNAPNTRRTSSQYPASASDLQQTDDSPSADDSTMVDLAGETFTNPTANGGAEDPNAQFDFGLQSSGGESMIPQTVTTGENMSGGHLDTATAALSQHYTMTVPRHPAESFANQPTASTANDSDQGNLGLDVVSRYHGPADENAALYSGLPFAPRTPKAPVGSEAWHKVRKDNHKEVERRRRETINEGINEISKIVPGCEKNKGSILQRAVQYIVKLHDEASQNIDKWTFEKLVTEQAINELSAKLSRAWAEKEAWKRIAREAGVDVDAVDLSSVVGSSGVAATADMGSAATVSAEEQRHGGGAPATAAAAAAASASTSTSVGAGEESPQVKQQGQMVEEAAAAAVA